MLSLPTYLVALELTQIQSRLEDTMDSFDMDTSSSSSSGDELRYPSTNPAADEFMEHPRKKRKTGRDAKESAALGIFGSESEDDRPKRRLRGKGVGFMKAGAAKEVEDGDDDDDQEDESYGMRATPLGRGFVPTSAQHPTLKPGLLADEVTTPKRVRPSFNSPAASFRQNGAGKGSSAQGAAVNPNSFAAKMMAKMGYVEGQGLGTSGQGIINPIETKLRPQGAGLGAVREKTEQAKEEAKREAARRGEVLEDSSEEERKRRRQKKERRIGGGSGTSTPGGGKAKPKLKYRTAAEIEAAADGLEVPNVLKSIIDATGKEHKLLTSTSGLMTPTEGVSTSEPEAMKIAKRARRDLEAFAEEWNGLKERKKYIELQESQLSREIDIEEEEFQKRKGVTDAVRSLQRLELNPGTSLSDRESLKGQWEEIVGKLEDLEIEYHDEIENFGLSEVAVGAIHPLFRVGMEAWDPIADPNHLVPYFHRLQTILGFKPQVQINSLSLQNGHHTEPRQSKSTTPYETMIYTLWLPKIRTAITNDWDVHDPSPLIAIIEAWKPILPPFIFTNIIDQLIVQKLTTAVSAWNPRIGHKKKHQAPPPHFWLFPWLPYLSEHHVDPKSSTGLLSDVKRKFRVVADTWDLTKGLIPGLENWREVLHREFDNLLIRHLLPRLSLHLQTELTIDPSDQDLTPLEQVLQWTPFFKPSILSALLVTEFFPKWHSILHLWLTSSPNYEEISQWFAWWKGRFPETLNELPTLTHEWELGLEMINRALDLGPDAASELAPPAAGPTRPIQISKETLPSTPEARTTAPAIEEATFKDVVEAWCAEEDLILLALREAHPQSGLPLFRITASANGRGGVLAYLKGDVVWAQDKRDKALWQPIGLGEGLVERAEGR